MRPTLRAPRRERASGGALTDPDRDTGHGAERAGAQVIGRRRQQPPRVRMAWTLEDFGRGALFDNAARVHHRDPSGDLGNDREVVGDVEHRNLLLVA